MLRKEVIGDTLDSHIARLFDTDADSDRLSKRFLFSSTFMGPIATFVRRKPDAAMEEKKNSAEFMTKDPMDTEKT